MPRRLYPPAAHRPRLRPVTSPPRGLTQRTRGFTGTREPLVKTRIVELVVALRAPQFRELVVASVNHEVANGARLDARELPVHVSAPLREAARDGAVLVPQNSANREGPLARSLFAHPRPLASRQLGLHQGVRFRKRDFQLHGGVVQGVGGANFSGTPQHPHGELARGVRVVFAEGKPGVRPFRRAFHDGKLVFQNRGRQRVRGELL
mmetsp:Transcript_9935/g.36926  ORF Transcript_9935/g.36926 Transcript_9935/m.36926 type:complete len:207 (-) Transcript_9935:762-1382(-)